MVINTDPAPETTLSAQDAAFVVELTAKGPLGIYGHNNALRLIRKLDAKLVAARKEELRLIECCKDLNREKNERNQASFDNYDRALKAEAKAAALAERLRVAEAGPCARCRECVCGHLTSDAAPAKSTDIV